MAKIMYSEITALSNKSGYCSAKNVYFAELYDVAKQTVSRWISQLNEFGFVHVQEIRDEFNRVIERRIFVVNEARGGIDEKINRVLTKRSIPIDKKIKDNNTSINNTSISIYKKQILEDEILFESACRMFRTNKEVIIKKLDEFIDLKKNIEGHVWRDFSDFRKHFSNWLKLSISENKTNGTRKQDQRTT